ncbi:MAG: amidohydrolase family protein [Conexibacter sp.]|nr:amidohydrolase family protein [Conexibacter sp.]
MPVRPLPHDDVVSDLRAEALAWLGDGVLWFDAHTHVGHHDPDGYEADPEELIAALDLAGQQKALVFAMQEPDGYRAPNDWVLRACAESGGRLVGLARIDPNDPGAMDEARRCLGAGARGFKLHPRSDAFGLPHPVVEEVVALAGRHRLPVLFHAGRGIPDLGDSVIHMATDHPDARLILAHAGISDLGLLGPRVAGLSNILFDTSWWQVSDLLTLFATVPPGQILYASDMPYGSPRYASMAMLRVARAVGLTPAQAAGIAGAQLERVLAGDDLLDLGPAPGTAGLGPRVLGFERAISYITAAAQMTFRGGDPTEPLALARLACQAQAEAEHYDALRAVDGLIAVAQQRSEAGGDPYAGVHAAMAAQVLAGTAVAPNRR